MTALCSYCIQRLALDSHGTETKPQKVVSLVSVNSLVPTMKKKCKNHLMHLLQQLDMPFTTLDGLIVMSRTT